MNAIQFTWFGRGMDASKRLGVLQGSRRLCCLLVGAALTAPTALFAYPPAPHHIIYGIVRDQMGNALMVTNAEVLLETSSGVQLKTTIVPNLQPGQNYRLSVPLDAGVTADAYKPTALQPTVPFRIRVKIGQTTYLPLEMTGEYAHLGQPAQTTRLDLTLGEDADGDGLPDAWERALIASLGTNLGLQDIRPGDDADHDGLSNFQEYLAGTYAFDPQDGFTLSISGFREGHPLLQFLTITGRNYTVLASPDLITWTPVQFRIPAQDPETTRRESYGAMDVRILQVEALVPSPEAPARLMFKAIVR